MKMHKKISALLLFLISFTTLHCSRPSSSGEGTSTKEIDESLNTIVTGYLTVKDALVSDNPGKAKDAAVSLASATGDYSVDLNPWLEKISSTEDIEEQREAFEHLSSYVYDLASASSTGVTLYKQFCPMAFDDKGAFWLSDSKEILNPYFGASMLRCGSVKEVID